MLHTVTARQMQKEYKRIFDRVKETQKPVVVISNSKPMVAIISIEQLEKIAPHYGLRELELIAIKEHEEGKTKVIRSVEELEEHFKEIDAEV